MSNLFKKKTFTMHSGDIGHWKIECDALSDKEIDTLAFIIADKVKFYEVIGIPRGGTRIAEALEKYKSSDGKGCYLIVDDVLTTGGSMNEIKKQHKDEWVLGVVLFARGECPGWVIPVFQMHRFFTE